MSLVERARALRHTIESLATVLTDEVATENVELFPAWNGNGVSYTTGDRVRYNGVLYKVLMDHTSQEGWTPEVSPSLFARVLIPDPEVIPVWEQPESTNGYMTGDKVYYPTADDDIYESLVDNNVWPPSAGDTLWRLISDEPPEVEPDPTPTPTPDPEPDEDEDEIPEWVQPDSTNPYMTGDKVTHNGKTWVCTVDNCVWEPGVYGWSEVTE